MQGLRRSRHFGPSIVAKMQASPFIFNWSLNPSFVAKGALKSLYFLLGHCSPFFFQKQARSHFPINVKKKRIRTDQSELFNKYRVVLHSL